MPHSRERGGRYCVESLALPGYYDRMDRRSGWGGGTRILVRALSGAAVIIGLSLSGGHVSAGEAAPASAGAAMRLHRDPQTGAIRGGPGPDALDDSAARATARAR